MHRCHLCDPITLGIASAVGSVASAGAGLYEGQQAAAGYADLQNKQNQANDQWVAYQNQIHQQQVQAEDLARQKATGVQQATLQKVSPQAQEAQQGAEAERLNTAYNATGQPGTATDSSNPQNLLLSGENSPSNQTFMNSLTSQVKSKPTAQARSRIQALATANSYGDSFGGLGTTTPIAFAQGGNDINLQNAIRQGNLKTYGVQQQGAAAQLHHRARTQSQRKHR